jgi:hypothetical protein
VTVSTHPDEAAAKEAVDAVLHAVPRSCTEFQPGRTRYTRRDNNRRGLVLPLGSRVIHLEAKDDHTVTHYASSDNGIALFCIFRALLMRTKLGREPARVRSERSRYRD